MESLGYLVGSAVLLGVVLAGTGFLLGGFRHRTWWRIALGGALISFAVLCVGAVARRELYMSQVDLNPTNISDSDVIGTWTRRSEHLDLRSDGSFHFWGPGTGDGRWNRSDWNLTLVGSGAPRSWRFIRSGQELRLVPDFGSDSSWTQTDEFRHGGT